MKSMYSVKSGICVLSPDMFIGMRNKQEACEYTPLQVLYAKGREIDILATLEENYEKCPPPLTNSWIRAWFELESFKISIKHDHRLRQASKQLLHGWMFDQTNFCQTLNQMASSFRRCLRNIQVKPVGGVTLSNIDWSLV